MKRLLAAPLVLGAAALITAAAAPLAAQERTEDKPVIGSVDVAGNQMIPRETLLFYVQTKPGDRYDERTLREDFRRLWDTGFLDDLQIDVRDGPKGKIVRFKVSERKRIQIVDFRGSKDLTTTTIEDELKKREAADQDRHLLRPGEGAQGRGDHQGDAGAKGRPFAHGQARGQDDRGVAGSSCPSSSTTGPRPRSRRSSSTGNTVFSDATLRGADEEDQGAGLLQPELAGGQDDLHRGQVAGRREGPAGRPGPARGLLPEPRLRAARGSVSRRSPTPTSQASSGRSRSKYMTLEIPVTEGDQYRVGEVKFEGLTVLKEDFVRRFFKMQPGDVYNDSKLQEGRTRSCATSTGRVGYFQWTGGAAAEARPREEGRRRHREDGGGQAVLRRPASPSPGTSPRATR